MKIIYYFLIIGLILVPIFAYLDVLAFGQTTFKNFLFVCLFEYGVFFIGVYVGTQLNKLEKRK